MRCFAIWEKNDAKEVYFRDQTILQFGDSWDFFASFILLNPGSAMPLNNKDQTDLLRSKNLPFFVNPKDDEKYVEFSIDRLMNDILKLFAEEYSGGIIRLYNLFNLKNQYLDQAIEQFSENLLYPKMFSLESEIRYCNEPVIVASGRNVEKNLRLKEELKRYISLAKIENLYKVSKIGNKQFSILKAEPDKYGFIDSFHPSYTFKYGNSTELGELKHRYDKKFN